MWQKIQCFDTVGWWQEGHLAWKYFVPAIFNGSSLADLQGTQLSRSDVTQTVTRKIAACWSRNITRQLWLNQPVKVTRVLDTQTDRQTDSQIDRQAGRQTDKQTDKQAERQMKSSRKMSNLSIVKFSLDIKRLQHLHHTLQHHCHQH